MRKIYFCLAAILLLFSSCGSQDKFTGLWTKERNTEYDAAAFPLWEKTAKEHLNANMVNTPLFVRITKEMDYYVLRCYQYDGAKKMVVAENSVFDFVKLTKTGSSTLISDNKASNIMLEKRMMMQVDDATGRLTMVFDLAKSELPPDKKSRSMFMTMFHSDFRKLMDIRRVSDDASLIDHKLRSENVIMAN
jgi:hypothetical protein